MSEESITIARFYIERDKPEVELATFISVAEEHSAALNAIRLPIEDLRHDWWVLASVESAAVDLTIPGRSETRNVWGEVVSPAEPGQSRPPSRLYEYEPREGVQMVSFHEWRRVAEEQRQQNIDTFPDEDFPEVPHEPPRYIFDDVLKDKRMAYANPKAKTSFS